MYSVVCKKEYSQLTINITGVKTTHGPHPRQHNWMTTLGENLQEKSMAENNDSSRPT